MSGVGDDVSVFVTSRTRLLCLVAGVVKFIELAVQDGDGVVAVLSNDSGPKLISLKRPA